ncbi:serine hydrolase [Stigmatella sp. ncwal1]|uniref:Serine hydrolase n=1 Tax=Stigmatella ashevillensis TaxID=2995309 RepID=A0ABT5DK57_9BACT|nr:serine hydrolase domain-containing protein [Stigmatella ashevillena]MDC0713525.1 serine hydrolase [Stigmatella ashevillena]
MNRRIFLVGGLLALCRPAWAEPRGALSPRQWLDRWLAAFNADSLGVYAAFVKAHVPTLVPYLDDDLGLREATGGFHLLRAEEGGPGEITAWFRDRNWDRRSRVVLKAEDDRIGDLTFLGAGESAPDVARLGERAAVSLLRQKLEAEADAGRFSGTVLVARNGRPLFRYASGLADASRSERMRADTRFCIGSMGKMFTAVATLQLVTRSQLTLSDPLSRWIPDYPNTEMARQVTVEHLLTHTGGTGDFFGPDYEANAASLKTPDDFIRLYGARAPLFPAGSRYGYSNYGFILLGALIERASGQRWDDYLRRNIFERVGMPSTSPLASAGKTAIPYTGASATGLKPLPFYVGLPAGGGYSTVDDLLRFGRGLRAGRLLDDRGLALLTAGRVTARDNRWSAGLKVAERGGASFYGHSGSAPGVNGDYAFYPRSGYETIVLSNRGYPSASNVAEYIGLRLPTAA